MIMNVDRLQPIAAMPVEAHNQHCSHAKSFAIQSRRCAQHAPSAETYLVDASVVGEMRRAASFGRLPAEGQPLLDHRSGHEAVQRAALSIAGVAKEAFVIVTNRKRAVRRHTILFHAESLRQLCIAASTWAHQQLQHVAALAREKQRDISLLGGGGTPRLPRDLHLARRSKAKRRGIRNSKTEPNAVRVFPLDWVA